MRSLFGWKRSLTGLGVDFGSSGVKAVALSSDRSGLTLLGAGREALEPGAVQDGAIQDPDAVGAALGRLLVRLGVRCRLVALAIGGSSVLVKRFPAPAEAVRSGKAGDGFRDVVAREAARHVPFHLESLEFDYEGPLPALAEPAPGEPARRERGAIVFGAAPRETVDNHCRSVTAAGRQVTRIELEPYALYSAAGFMTSLTSPDREPGALAIVEIGASRAGVHVFGGSPPPHRLIPGNHSAPDPGAGAGAPADLLASIPAPGAGAREVDRPPLDAAPQFEPAGRAGHSERQETGWPERPANDADVFWNRIVATVREALREADPRGGVRLCVSGGGAGLPGMCARLEKLELGEPLVLDPLGQLGSRDKEPAFSVAAGLAYQQILDLTGPENGRRS